MFIEFKNPNHCNHNVTVDINGIAVIASLNDEHEAWDRGFRTSLIMKNGYGYDHVYVADTYPEVLDKLKVPHE